MCPQVLRRADDAGYGDQYDIQPGQWAPRMSDAQFDFFRSLANAHAGITLPDYKRNMVYRRVSKRLMALNMPDFATYQDLLSSPRGQDEIEFFVNALTTNKTEFFRENHHFEHLASVALPRLHGTRNIEGRRKLRIWSAGCSTGQEPYSIAMTVFESEIDPARWDVKILATDIDTDVLEIGYSGVFPASEIQSIPLRLRQEYVDLPEQENGIGRMAYGLRSLTIFNQLNLHGPWPMKAKFDIIFCRNVIIYFDKPSQRQLFDRFADQLSEGGYLYIGHSESLFKVTERFRSIGQSIYQKIA
jgi:chemotaxis protein methyltransferase CheR